jgi:O-Antigen ligase
MAVAERTRVGGLPRAEEPIEPERGAAPWALAAALGIAVLYAAVANGSINIPDETRLQVGVAVVSLLAIAALLFGSQLRFVPDGRARIGLWLLAGFAAWSALSLTWSIAPDETWVEVNRAIAYTLVVLLAIVLGSSLPRAAERVAIGYLVIATLISLYAVAGKVAPWALQHAEEVSRLRAPLDYWNALALFCVLAVPIAIQVAADERFSARARMAGLLSLLPLLLAVALTYSRGGIAVMVIAVAVQVGLARERMKLVAFAAVGAVAVVPALLVAVMRDDLTTDRLPAYLRNDDGVMLGVALLVGALAALVAGRMLMNAGDRVRLSDAGRALVRRAAIVAAGIGVVALLALTVTGWTGDQLESFSETKGDKVTDPSRVFQASSGNRWTWWKEAAGAAWDEPVTGHGAGSFPLLHLAYRENNIEVLQPHSVPLEFLSETGVVGGLLGLGGILLLLIAAVARVRWRVGAERAFAAALAGGAVAWVLHLWIDWDWDIPGVTVPALIFIGVLAAAPVAAERPLPNRGRVGRALGLAAIGVALALFCASAVLPALSQDKTNEALELSASNKPEDLREAAEAAEQARRLNPFAVDPLFAASGIADKRGQPKLAVELLTDAVERQPDNARGWLRLARRQVLLDDLPAAARSIGYVYELDPHTVGGFFAGILGSIDEARSATATGTPLPLIFVPLTIPGLALPEAPSTPATPAPQAPAPAPAPTPAPAPAPAPTPQPEPQPQPEGEPFRLEG